MKPLLVALCALGLILCTRYSVLGTSFSPSAPELRQLAVIEPASDDELLITAAFSPDGSRLAYGTERRIQRRGVAAEDDGMYFYPGEVWVTDFAEKTKRILKYDFLRSQEGGFLSFSVERVAWSPDGSKLLIEVSDEKKNTATFFFSAEGKRVRLGEKGPNFAPGYGGEWLADNESVGLLSEVASPRLLHRIHLLRATAGRALPLFGSKVFAAVAWLPRSQRVAAVERDKEFSHPPELVLGNLEDGTLEDLGNVPDYAGGLRALPDERRVSYFIGNDKLAVRALAADAKPDVLPIPLGRYEWAGPDAVLFIEPRQPGERTGRLVLFDLAFAQKRELLEDELVQDFWVSPDGARVAVLTAGQNPLLKLYRLN
ncbi:MAG: hypothetical protein L0212_09965 [Acidobacteria bacterium]|nr:hypothetical protein [Acidobacteriota bacterium]